MSKQFHPNLRSRAILGKVIKQFGKEKIGILLARLLYHLTIEGEELIPLSGPISPTRYVFW